MPDTFSVERGSLTTGVWWVRMAVKLHRCRFEWLKTGPCWRVEKALKEMGVDYELAPGRPWPSKRDEMIKMSRATAARRQGGGTISHLLRCLA